MPPRKSLEAKAAGTKAADEETPSRSATKTRDTLPIEDLTLPRSMIQRLAKGVLPLNTQIQKDALLAIHKSATVFVNYLADSANDRAILANKKTIQPKDVLEALAELEFESFLPRCEAEMALYNTIQCTKRNDYRRRMRVEPKALATLPFDLAAGGEGTVADHVNNDHSTASADMNGHEGQNRDSEPAAKKARISTNGNGVENHDGDEDDEDAINEQNEDEVEVSDIDDDVEDKNEEDASEPEGEDVVDVDPVERDHDDDEGEEASDEE